MTPQTQPASAAAVLQRVRQQVSSAAESNQAWRERVKNAPQRIGCAACDFVGHAEPRQTEDALHIQPCPRCGEQNLHEYPVRGTWPSECGEGCPFENDGNGS